VCWKSNKGIEMNRSRRSWPIIVVSLLFAADVSAADPDTAALKAADAAWNDAMQSRSSERVSRFYENEAVADLAPAPPVRGKAAIEEFWATAFKDPKYALRWELETAGVIASSGLGYTLGRWYQQSAEGGSTGVYVAFWQRQPDGRWLVVVDTARE
jgi:ketosteroid isomerase-like protein